MATPLYVFANGSAGTGNEVWIAGAGLASPRLLKDIAPGASADPDQFTSLPDGRVLFVANDGLHGRELWTTDGTEAGTRLLRDIGTGDGTTGPDQLTALPDGRVLFTADNGTTGRELWVTDGSLGGTRLLKDIHAGAAGSGIGDFTAVAGGRFVFSADDGVHGQEWWSTDGTEAGTFLLKDRTPGAFGSYDNLSRIDGDGTLFSTGSSDFDYPGDYTLAYGEWKTDGTVAGTVKVSDYESIGRIGLQQIDGDTWVFKQYYYGGGSVKNYIQAVYVTDGTVAGTRIIRDRMGSPGAPSEMFSLGNGLVVFPQPQEIWVTDGTEAGTRSIARIENLWVGGNDFAVVDGKLLIANVVRNYDGTPDTAALFITDGTAAGTRQLSGYLPHNPASLPEEIAVLQDGSLVFSAPAMDGQAGIVWKVDLAAGSVAPQDGLNAWTGEIALGAVQPGAATPPEAPATPPPAAPEAYLFVNAEGTHGREIWVADGAFGGRHLLKDIHSGAAGSDPSELVQLGGGRALFVADDGIHGRELWISDGSGAGTRMLRDIGTGDGTTGPSGLLATGDGRVLFSADDGLHGRELWVTDGTAPGTGRLTDAVPGAGGSAPADLVAVGSGHWIFTALGADGLRALWSTDGTAAGTRVIRPAEPGEGLTFQGIEVSSDGARALVQTSRGSFTTDGTAGGTGALVAGRSGLEHHAVEGGRWVFADVETGAAGDGHGNALYSTDGTAAGTVKILSPQEPPIGGRISGEARITELGDGQVIFQAARDLFVSDGTEAGTRLIGDDILGLSFATDFVGLGDGRALFMTQDRAAPQAAATAADLWITDGTREGTLQIADSRGWNAGSLPEAVSLLADGSVVFSAASLDGNPNAVWHASPWAGGLQRLDDLSHWSGEAQPVQLAALQHDGIWG
jgi:ELWxxDGT repeat protein